MFDGTWEASGLRYAARAQIIADLLGSPAPAPAQAASLLEIRGRARRERQRGVSVSSLRSSSAFFERASGCAFR